MKIGFIFDCGPDGPDFQVCRQLVHKLDPAIEFVPNTLDNKKNWWKTVALWPKFYWVNVKK